MATYLNTTSSDLSIFSNIDQYPSSDCHDYKSCIAIKRLSSALRYYATLNIQNNKHDQETFTNFVQEIYKHTLLIEDLYHFQKQHDHQLHEIMNYLINDKIHKKCDIDSCQYSSRHYRVKSTNDTNNINAMDRHLKLYGDTLDSFHFYLNS